VTLVGGFLSCDADNSHSAQRAFPYDLPGVPAMPETYLAPGPVGALSYRVPMEGEPVGLDVNVSGTIFRVPGVTESS